MSVDNLSVKRTIFYGPLQLFVIGFSGNHFSGEIFPAIDEARQKGIIRLIDYIFVMRDESGKIASAKGTDLGKKEMNFFETVLGALKGFGMAGLEGAKAGVSNVAEFGEHDFGISEQDLQDIVGYIPKNSSALLLIVEHIWAKKIKQSLVNANGTMIAQGMITPELVIKAGENLAADITSLD
jgi:uncharacterized membrane protein